MMAALFCLYFGQFKASITTYCLECFQIGVQFEVIRDRTSSRNGLNRKRTSRFAKVGETGLGSVLINWGVDNISQAPPAHPANCFVQPHSKCRNSKVEYVLSWGSR